MDEINSNETGAFNSKQRNIGVPDVGQSATWQIAFEFIQLEWISPIHRPLGLSLDLIDDMPVIQATYEKLKRDLSICEEQHRRHWRWSVDLIGISSDLAEMRRLSLLMVLRQSFKGLAAEIGNNKARDLELWIRRHYVNNERHRLISTWHSLFMGIGALRKSSPRQQQLKAVQQSQPPCLDRIWPPGKSYFQQLALLDELVDDASGSCFEGDFFEEDTPLGYQRAAASNILSTQLAIKTLKTIITEFTSPEIRVFMDWLEPFVEAYGSMSKRTYQTVRDQGLTDKILAEDCPTLIY